MPNINRDQIRVPQRQRKEINETALLELKDSIKRHGLFHAIVVEKVDDLSTPYRLIAGERRLNAMRLLHQENVRFDHNGKLVPVDAIPCVLINNEDEIARMEAELDENLKRVDLTWPEKLQAQSDLHKLRVAQNPSQTFTDTAREIGNVTGGSPTYISQEISRALVTADFLDRPEVRNAENEKKAFNAATRIIRDEFTSLLRRTVTEESNHTFFEGDATKKMEELEDRKFSCFIMDPPYGMGADKFGNAASSSHDYNDSLEYAYELSRKLIYEAFFKGTDDAHLWMFCDIDLFCDLREEATLLGWKVNRTPLVWNSGTSGHIPDQKVGIRRNYELLLFARKGERGLANILDDVIRINMRDAEGTGAQKPIELYELLLRQSTLPGDFVLDPTCGVGTIFAAAERVGVNAVGIEFAASLADRARNLITELEAEREDDEKLW